MREKHANNGFDENPPKIENALFGKTCNGKLSDQNVVGKEGLRWAEDQEER